MTLLRQVGLGRSMKREEFDENMNEFPNKFATIAALKAATWLQVGQVVAVEEYHAGIGGGMLFGRIVAGGSGVDDGGSYIDLAASGLQFEQNFPSVISVKMFGAKPGYYENNRYAIFSAISYSAGGCLDFDGCNYGVDNYILCDINEDLIIQNGSIFASDEASDLVYVLGVKTTANLTLNNIKIDARHLASKCIYVYPNSATSEIFLYNFTGKNGLQTNTATSFAAGAHIQPEAGVGSYFAKCVVRDSSFLDCTSTKTYTGLLTSVGRGIYVSDCEYFQIYDSRVERIGPYYDGDGVVVTADSSVVGRRPSFKFNCDGLVSVDCEKRAVKSQVGKSTVRNVTITRNQNFDLSNTETTTEISLQNGGVVENINCWYNSDSQPRSVVNVLINESGGFNSSKCKVSNINVAAESASDSLREVVFVALNDNGEPMSNVVISNLNIGMNLTSVVRLYTSNQSLNQVKFKSVAINNVLFNDFNGDSENSIVVMSRGSLSYNEANIYIDNVVSTNNSIKPAFYLDASAGSTSFLKANIKKISNTIFSEGRKVEKTTGLFTSYNFLTNEGSYFSKTIEMDSAYSSCLVWVIGNGADNSIGKKLITHGVIHSSISRTYYNELIAGQKSGVVCGEISIEEDTLNNRFTVTKTEGSGSDSFYIRIIISESGMTKEPL